MLSETIKKYNNDFLPKYCSLLEKLEEYNKKKQLTAEENKELFDKWQQIFSSAIELLREYMSFVGLYPANNLATVRSAYYNEIIKNGQDWINLHYYLSTNNTRDAKLISEKYLELFEQIRLYIESEIEVYNV